MRTPSLSSGADPDSIRLLHVDDEPGFAEMASEFLDRNIDRLEVITEPDVRGGLETLDAESIDCVVSDYEMPGANGIEFLETVREEYPDLPFILFTGRGSEAVASEAFTAGATDYLQKEGGTHQYTVLANKVTNYVEKYRAERAMSRRAQAMEAANEGIAILDEDGRYLEVNETYTDILGTTPESLGGRHWTETVPDDEAAFIQGEALEEVQQDRAWSGTVTGRRLDGETFPKFLSLAPLDTAGHVCVVRDISERESRKRAISNLHRTARQLMDAGTSAAICEIATDAARDILRLPATSIYRYDERRTVLEPSDWTEETERLVGTPPVFEPGESIAWTVYETGEAQMYDDISTDERRYNPQTRVRSEIILPLGDHGVLLVGSAEPAAFDETDVSLAKTLSAHVRTALDRIEREAAIKKSEARYRSLADDVLDTSAVATVVLDSDFEVVWVSEATTTYFGLARESMVGADKRHLVDTHMRDIVEDSETFVETVTAAYDDNTYVEEFECHVLPGADREERWLKHWSEPIESGLYAGGRIEHYTDVTSRKRRERELREQNQRLDEFASIVSHDLRNPLTVAEGHVELASEDCESEHLETVARAHERMDALIDDLLTLARRGEEIGSVEVVSLDGVVEECWSNLAASDATLALDGECEMNADRSRLRQLLSNLLQNAVDHGGEAVSITVGTLDGGFYVEDDGPGIPSGHRERVFEVGYSSADDGTGFGLRIAQQVVEAHDWEIRVTEGSDGGARFEVTGVDIVDR